MNLLVIGNGFDIALGLPTKYTDFLDFVRVFNILYPIQTMYSDDKIQSHFQKALEGKGVGNGTESSVEQKYKKDLCIQILPRFSSCLNHQFLVQSVKDMHYCIHKNRWSKYFQQSMDDKTLTNWCGIEQELKKVIRNIEKSGYLDETAKDSFHFTDEWSKIEIELLNSGSASKLSEKEYYIVKQALREEFNNFIMALGIYLGFFVSLSKEKLSLPKTILKLMEDQSTKITHILNFNYIDNITPLIKKENKHNDFMCFVHGRSDYMEALNTGTNIDDIIKSNTMVLGFDEYLDSETKSDMLDFVYYRKYFQRIFKATDNSYVKWLKEPLKSEDKPHQVFIFGHSLDETDREIFKYIFADGIKTTIFYHSDEAKDRIITNLIHILGQDTLVNKVNGLVPDIKFVRQSE